MPEFASQLRQNLQAVEQRISQACLRSGRPRSAVTMVAVTKYAQWPWVEALVETGQLDLGENRPQQLVERAALLTKPVTWHLIGHLQSNKAKSVLPVAPWIHSIDSLKLLSIVDRLAGELSLRPQLLLEVNVTGEATKYGFTPEELRVGWSAVVGCEHVEVCGLMTMAAIVEDPELARPAFQNLRTLRDELQAISPAGMSLPHLSMGMTSDFEVAIEEGATFVRIGSALFEGLA
jgi:PLP dependent protein